jgi:hypothetical protein
LGDVFDGFFLTIKEDNYCRRRFFLKVFPQRFPFLNESPSFPEKFQES